MAKTAEWEFASSPIIYNGVLIIQCDVLDNLFVALNGYKQRAAYDFETGKEIWSMTGGGDIQIPTPIVGNDIIYFNSAHGQSSPIIAVKPMLWEI
jgi:outer membrane protein assembly factor BamB